MDSVAEEHDDRFVPKLGLDFSFGFFHLPLRERLRLIGEAGFDAIMIILRAAAFESASPADVFEAATRQGLRVTVVHAPTDHAADLWRNTQAGAAYEQSLLEGVRFCAERGASNLVLHTTRRLETPPPNETGAARAFRLAEAAEKYGVNLAWENTRFPDYNAYLYARVPSPRMRFCFDSGHANCFTPGEDPLARFGERMTAMHLHDNHGPRLGDEHLLPGQGEIDFPALMRRLKAYRPEYYHLESRFETDGTETAADMAAYLRDAYSRLRVLTQL